jgi:hypothetical protein
MFGAEPGKCTMSTILPECLWSVRFWHRQPSIKVVQVLENLLIETVLQLADDARLVEE